MNEETNYMKYFVDWCSHNEETGAWNYKQATMFDNFAAAKKKYHETISTYMMYGKLDYLMVILYDSEGRKYMTERWKKEAEPVPPNDEDDI